MKQKIQMYRSFRTDFTKDSAVRIKVKILIFFPLFFQQTRQQHLQDRVNLLTVYGYAKLREGLAIYLFFFEQR